MDTKYKENLAYVIGLALGDGNLSNPNGRATRLRISCDTKYPNLMQQIIVALKLLLPENKVNTVIRPRNCIDVYCYSNQFEKLLGWKAASGSKFIQQAHIPAWIMKRKKYMVACLRGLFQTDGSIYVDRGYSMVIFVTIIPNLARDVIEIMNRLGFRPHSYLIELLPPRHPRYNIRLSKNVEKFIHEISLVKN